VSKAKNKEEIASRKEEPKMVRMTDELTQLLASIMRLLQCDIDGEHCITQALPRRCLRPIRHACSALMAATTVAAPTIV
jgi:hypothetical protein